MQPIAKRRAIGKVGVHEASELHPYWAVALSVYMQTACAPWAPPSLFSHTHEKFCPHPAPHPFAVQLQPCSPPTPVSVRPSLTPPPPPRPLGVASPQPQPWYECDCSVILLFSQLLVLHI